MDFAPSTSEDRQIERTLSIINHSSVGVVSFDIFDTLVTRRFWAPSDVFVSMSRRPEVIEIMLGERFDVVRHYAERRSRERKSQCDPTLEEIYECLAEICDLSQTQCEQLIKIEQDLEVSAALPRSPIWNTWQQSIRLEKEVIFCSDMYLPSPIIKQILRRSGYDLPSQLFLSSELGVTKRHGTLFNFVSEKMQISPKNFLHIGDNWHSDFQMARKAGWQALHTPKACDRVFEPKRNGLIGLIPSYQKGEEIKTFATRSSLKLISERLFSERLDTKADSSTLVKSGEDFGYAALGPFLLSLTLWIRRLAQQRDQKHMLFLARDGWLPMAATRMLDDSLGPAFQSSYLPISRRMIFPWLLTKPAGFEQIARISFVQGLTVDAYLTERFGSSGRKVFLEAAGSHGEQILPQMLQDHLEMVISVLRKHQGQLRALAAPEAERIETYFRGAIPKDGAAALFDVGRKGTFQRVLTNITRRPLHGYYVMTTQAIHDNVPDRSFDPFLGIIDWKMRRRNPDTIAYEALLSERAGSYAGISVDGAPIRECRPTEDSDSQFKRIHSGAMDFISDAISNFGEDVLLLEQEPSYAAYALENWSRNKGIASLFAQLKHEDSISSPFARTLSDALRGVGLVKQRSPSFQRQLSQFLPFAEFRK